RAAAHRQRMRVEGERVALVECRAREDDEAAHLLRERLRDQAGGCGLLRREDHRLLRQAPGARRGAPESPGEEVEKDEKRDFEEQQRRLDLGRSDHSSSSRLNVRSVEPTVNVVPSSSFSRLTRLPFTSTPFVESRSISQ